MSAGGFSLFGFACGGAVAPQFVEPVFFRSGRLWAQSSSDGGGAVSGFVEFNEDVEIMDDSFAGDARVGDRRTFAVRDAGDRVVYGERPYLARYLTQNLKNYVDKPYFFCDAARFSGADIAELNFLVAHADLMEAAALANSVRRFCEQEPAHATRLRAGTYHMMTPALAARGDARVHDGGAEKETIFSQWLRFAMTDSPRLAKFSRWRTLDKNYQALFSAENRTIPHYLLIYFHMAESLLRDRTHLVLEARKEEHHAKAKRLFMRRFIDKFAKDHLDGINSRILSLEMLGGADRRAGGARRYEGDREIAKFTLRALIKSILTKQLSIVDLSMSVYFLKLVMKFHADRSKA